MAFASLGVTISILEILGNEEKAGDSVGLNAKQARRGDEEDDDGLSPFIHFNLTLIFFICRSRVVKGGGAFYYTSLLHNTNP